MLIPQQAAAARPHARKRADVRCARRVGNVAVRARPAVPSPLHVLRRPSPNGANRFCDGVFRFKTSRPAGRFVTRVFLLTNGAHDQNPTSNVVRIKSFRMIYRCAYTLWTSTAFCQRNPSLLLILENLVLLTSERCVPMYNVRITVSKRARSLARTD